MWTQFMDMHSGGGTKEKPYEYIYIEAPEDEAKVIFYNRFGHNPQRVSCTCCGDDYSISSNETLAGLTGFERGCAYVYRDPQGEVCSQDEAWRRGHGMREGYTAGYEEFQDPETSYRKYTPLADYLVNPKCLFIPAKEIHESERVGEVPEQGYVWKG